MKLNIKSLLIFAVIYSSIYSMLISNFSSVTNIKDNASLNFLNYQNAFNYEYNVLSGNSWQFTIFNSTINLTFIPYVITYFIVILTVIFEFFGNIVYEIQYGIEILNLPATILPYGIGYLMDTVFISTLILLIVTSIQILSSGLKGD